MIINRIYTGDDGQSHFEEIDVPLEDADWGQTSALIQTQGLRFRQTPSGGELDFHNAPRRQWVIMLGGSITISVGDGSSRTLVAGDVLLAEDVSGQGHTTVVNGGWPRAVIPRRSVA